MAPGARIACDEDFPELSKCTGRKGKGRRSAAADRHVRQMATAGVLVKTIDDPNHVLGKRRKDRMLSETIDGIAPHVPYSLNRKNRWSEDATSLLDHADLVDQPLAVVVERAITSKGSTAMAIHTKNVDDVIETLTAGGKGTNLNALVTGNGKKKSKKEKSAQQIGEDSEVSTSEADDEKSGSTPRVMYTIYKPHSNQRVLTGKLFKRGYNTRKAGRVHAQQNIDACDVELSELDVSVHLDDPVYKPSRDLKFCLGDYISDKKEDKSMVFVRRQSIESVGQAEAMDEAGDDAAKPFKLFVDVPTDTKRWQSTYEVVSLPMSFLDAPFKFNEVEQILMPLRAELGLKMEWLDADKSRFSVSLKEESYERNKWYLIFERTEKQGEFKFLANIADHVEGRVLNDNVRMHIYLKQARTLPAIIRTIYHFASFQGNMYQKGAECSPMLKEYLTLKYTPKCTAWLVERVSPLPLDTMVASVRDEGIREQVDSFERIEAEFDFGSDCEDDIGVVVKPTQSRIKCDSCAESLREELFELDDCWRCRICLRRQIAALIRSDGSPLDIPFALLEGQSTYDILPAIIPLKMMFVYTKMRAIDLYKTAHPNVDVIDCKNCGQCVILELPFKHRACFCTNCELSWCMDCSFEPHWPMLCDEYSAWSDKWNEEYLLRYINKMYYVRQFACVKCETTMLALEGQTVITCDGCRSQHDVVTGKRIGQDDKEDQTDKDKSRDVKRIFVPKTIKKEFSEICGEARSARLDIAKKTEFEKNLKKLNHKLGYTEIRKELQQSRTAVLILVENGFAFIYMRKIAGCSKLKTALKKLLRLWEDIEDSLNEEPSPKLKDNLLEKLTNIKNTYFKVAELIEEHTE